jgi:hypothetical protein
MRVAILLLHFPQALQTAEHVAAPQHDAAKVASWDVVSEDGCKKEKGDSRYRCWGQQEEVVIAERPSSLLEMMLPVIWCCRRSLDSKYDRHLERERRKGRKAQLFGAAKTDLLHSGRDSRVCYRLGRLNLFSTISSQLPALRDFRVYVV